MLLQRNSQKRFQSSTRIDLARDLHDSLAQDLIAIGFKLDLLLHHAPLRIRKELREIRFDLSEAIKRVRQELFALRAAEGDFQAQLVDSAAPLELAIQGSLSQVNLNLRKVIDELVKNAALHSKGRKVQVRITEKSILVSDDGLGFFGICEVVEALGGSLSVTTASTGTKVAITFP